MFNWVRQRVLELMRVPPDPEPPFGAPGSVRVFRAGRNYYNLRLIRWGLGQAGALVGLAISLTFFAWFKSEVEAAKLAREPAVIAPPAQSTAPVVAPVANPASPTPARKTYKPKRDPRQDLRVAAAHTPGWVILVIEIFEFGSVLLFLAQIPVTFAAVRLDFELHWYIVTDRSLRIRTGLFRLQEATMSFANLQQVEVKQGPLQRLLGLADVHVQSAGGGEREHGQVGDSLHTGIFHSVNNANEIRDLILERLRQFRQAGLGDHDDHNHAPAAAAVGSAEMAGGDAIAAARELLAEARALRQALG